MDTLVDLHALARLGRPAGFVERQIHGWTNRWRASQTSDVPDMETVAAWLKSHRPAEPSRYAVVHGDFKLDNVMFDRHELSSVVAVFDWEMSAIGDPLVDLGILLAYWSAAALPGQQDALTTVTGQPGYLTRSEIVERYALRSGRDVSGIGFYETFALFKIAVVIQQIFCRFASGQTTDQRFSSFGDRVASLARQAAEGLSRSHILR